MNDSTSVVDVRGFLAAWHSTVDKKDIGLMDAWVAEDVQLVSPALYRPKDGKSVVTPLLADVLASLENYKVTKTWTDGSEILLEFDAQVKGYAIQGIDRITLNNEGKMVRLKVFIRPFTGLKALIASVVELQINRLTGFRKVLAQTTFALKSRL